MIAVVIAATDSAEAASRCAASIGPGVRVIVAFDPSRVEASGLPADVEAVAGDPGAGVHRLRRLGFDRCGEPIVAFTEDSCWLAPGWAIGWLPSFERRGILAATGAVELASGRSLLDRAVFLCEYAPFLSNPRESGSPTRLAGNNFALRRENIPTDGADIHEFEVAKGGRLALAPLTLALHVRRHGVREAIRDRVRFGFGFGRSCAGSMPQRRWSRIVFGPAILGSQLARLATTLLRKRRLDGAFISALPLTALLLTAWSVGEWLGWTVGPARRASGRSGEGSAQPVSPSPDQSRSLQHDCREMPGVA